MGVRPFRPMYVEHSSEPNVHFAWSPYPLIPLAIASLLLATAVFVGRYRVRRTGPHFVLLLCALAFWLACDALALLAVDRPDKIFFDKLKYLGLEALGPLLLLVAIHSCDRQKPLARWVYGVLALPGLSVLAMIATNESHQLYWKAVHVVEVAGVSRLVAERGPGFWFSTAETYGFVVVALLFFVLGRRTRPDERRRELRVAIPAILIPLSASLVFMSGASVARLLDPTPIAIGISALIVTWGILRAGILDVTRVAHREIIDGLVDPVVVLDARDRMVSFNQAACDRLGLSRAQLARPFADAVAHRPELVRFVAETERGQAEIYWDAGEPDLWFSVGLAPLRDVFGNETCRILVLRDVSRYKAAEKRIRALAYYDGLTGLPNRERFRHVLERSLSTARDRGRPVAILFLDLDRFKEVNDTLGHRVGDALLRAVAQRFETSVRISDCVSRSGGSEAVSRLGGDEFTFLLTKISGPLDAARVAQRLLDSLSEPFQLDGHEVFASASIGIAMHPTDGDDAETLLRNADTAMYVAKRRGSNECSFYDETMNARGIRRLALEGRLRGALDRGELSLVYQPLRQTASSRIVGAEALLRWQSDGEAVSPDEFIPIAEETGLIHEIGEWVLETACAQAAAWRAAGHRPVRMGVNISSHQLRRAGFADVVRAVLERSGWSPAHLDLELTESSIMGDDDGTQNALQTLDALGVGLTLDDFGTGYSSLSYLRRFPLQRVKIDRSFVRDLVDDPGDRALTDAILAMGQSLGLTVVAEGVETVEQARLLERMGCDELQGFLIGRPAPPEAFREHLEPEKDPDDDAES